MERGAILLFEHGSAWYERLIVWATHGPYVHTEICLGNNLMIGAHGDRRGIYERNWLDSPQIVTQVSLLPYTDPEHIERALAWAIEQQGRAYGWLDIVSQAIKFLWPMTFIRLSKKDAWDCSDFVTRYLIKAGVDLPEDFLIPDENSPNDIGRVLNVLPERPQRTRKRKREEEQGHVITATATARRP